MINFRIFSFKFFGQGTSFFLLVLVSAIMVSEAQDAHEIDELIQSLNTEYRDSLFIWIDSPSQSLRFDIYNNNREPVLSGQMNSANPNTLRINNVEYNLNQFSGNGDLVEAILRRNPEIAKEHDEKSRIMRVLDFFIEPAQSHPLVFGWKPVIYAVEVVALVFVVRMLSKSSSGCTSFDQELQKCLNYYRTFHSTSQSERVDIYEYLAAKKLEFDQVLSTKCPEPRIKFMQCFVNYRATLQNSPFGMSRMQEFRVRPPQSFQSAQ